MRYFLILTTFTFHSGVYFFSNSFSIKILLALWTAQFLLLLENYFNTPTKDSVGSVGVIVLSLLNPCLAVIDPLIVTAAQHLNNAAILAAYMMMDLNIRLNIAILLTNMSAWSIFWVFHQDSICFESYVSQELGCMDSKVVFTQFITNGFIALYCFGFIKYIAIIFSEHKETKTQLEMSIQDLQKSNEELRKTLELNDNFLVAFAHELKNPLNALLGSIELAQDETSLSEHNFLLSNAELSGRMILHLVTNVLDSGKIQFDKLDVNYQPANFAKYIEHFWHNISSLIKSKGLQGSLSIKKDFPSQISFDSHRLSQILLNLVSNSLKFTEKGHINLFFSFEEGTELPLEKFESTALNRPSDDYDELSQFEKKNPRSLVFQPNPLNKNPILIHDQGVPEDNEAFQLDYLKKYFPINYFKPQKHIKEGYIRIEIVDTGCGMDAEQLSCLFQRYSQVNQNSSKRQSGTGLGLWISKELCRLMNGDIKVTSQARVGSSFVVMIRAQGLPTQREVQARGDIKLADVISKSQTLGSRTFTEVSEVKMTSSLDGILRATPSLSLQNRVLIAEDLVYNQEIYARMFKKNNIEPFICRDGSEAVKVFKQAPPNYFMFLLFDLNMPKLDGIAASERIREHEVANSLNKSHIFILTGHCTQETKKKCLDTNGPVKASDVLIKPMTQADISRICQMAKHQKCPFKKYERINPS